MPDPKEVEATEHVIHRVFLPGDKKMHDWREKLPKLTQSNEINVQLYAFVALIYQQFVQSWHSKISDDKTFKHEVLETVSKVVQNIEKRVLNVEVDEALLVGIPNILETHVEDLDRAKERFGTGLMPVDSLEKAFHSLRPHPALESAESEQLFRKVLARALMLVLIDDQNVESAAARTLVSTIMNDIVLKTAIERLSEPWMIYEIIIKVLDTVNSRTASSGNDDSPRMGDKRKSASNNINSEKQEDGEKNTPLSIQVGRLYHRAVKSCASLISYGGRTIAYVVSLSREAGEIKTPVASSSLFSCIFKLFRLDIKSPLLVSTVNTLAIPFSSGRLADISTKAASRVISQHVRNEKLVCTVLKAARETLFPNNGPMGPPKIIPDAEQQEQLRIRARQAILDTTPSQLKPVMFGYKTELQSVDKILDIFSNKQINKHLVYNLIDYLVILLMPELAEKTPMQIHDERLGIV